MTPERRDEVGRGRVSAIGITGLSITLMLLFDVLFLAIIAWWPPPVDVTKSDRN